MGHQMISWGEIRVAVVFGPSALNEATIAG